MYLLCRTCDSELIDLDGLEIDELMSLRRRHDDSHEAYVVADKNDINYMLTFSVFIDAIPEEERDAYVLRRYGLVG